MSKRRPRERFHYDLVISEEMILRSNDMVTQLIKYTLAHLRSQNVYVDEIKQVPYQELSHNDTMYGISRLRFFFTHQKSPLVKSKYLTARLVEDHSDIPSF